MKTARWPRPLSPLRARRRLYMREKYENGRSGRSSEVE